MENLFSQIDSALNQLRDAKGEKLNQSLEFLLAVLKAVPVLPHSLLKILIVRVSSIVKSKEVNRLSLETLLFIIRDDFLIEILDDSQESNMILSITLSALVTNIEKDEAGLRRIAWQGLGKLVKYLPSNVIKACFPGLLKVSLEELKKFRCQGLGSSEVGFFSCLDCLNRLIAEIKNEKGEWKALATEKSKAAFSVCAEELLMIELKTDCQKTAEILEGFFEVFRLKEEEIFEYLVKAHAKNGVKIRMKADGKLVKKVILDQIAKFDECAGQKKFTIKVLAKCFELTGTELAVFLNLYKEAVLKFLRKLYTVQYPVYFEEFKLEDWIVVAEKDQECLEAIKEFVKVSVKFEVFDELFNEQHRLLKKFKGGLSTEESQAVVSLCLIFFDVYPESSLHILSEFIFLENLEAKFLIFSKFLFTQISKSLYLKNELSLSELLENIFFSYTAETSKECLEIFQFIRMKNSKESISCIIQANEKTISASLLLKLKLFGPVSLSSAISQYLLFIENLDSTNSFLAEVLKIFDANHKKYSHLQLLSFFQMLQSIVKAVKSSLNSQQIKLKTGNSIRNLLMRTKSFLALRSNTTENRKIIYACLSVFKESLEVLDNVPFEIDPLDRSPFAFEEEPNVSIPNGLSEIAYEFLPALVNCFKMMADSSCFGITLALVEILREIHRFDDEFFLTDKRFVARFFQPLKVFLKNLNFGSGFSVKIGVEMTELMIRLGRKVLLDVRQEVLEISERWVDGELKNRAAELRRILE